jgi:hypothetical protein
MKYLNDLIYNYFSISFYTKKPVCSEISTTGMVMLSIVPIGVLDRGFQLSPLLHHDYSRVSECWSHGLTVLSRKDMAPSIEDTLPLGTCIPQPRS